MLQTVGMCRRRMFSNRRRIARSLIASWSNQLTVWCDRARAVSLPAQVAILIMVLAAVLVVANGTLVPSIDVLPLDSAGWAKRIPLTLLFALTYALTVTRYYAKTTTKVPGIAQSIGRAPGRSAPRAKAEGGGL